MILGKTSEVVETSDLPQMNFKHLLCMCDDTGIIQHAIHSVPDRHHGYCVDDNARALLLACTLPVCGQRPLSQALTAKFAAFVQHAWNPDTRRFRNFMSYDRRWLEDKGSEDSHGRTLWALGTCAHTDIQPARRAWAAALFCEGLPTAEHFSSPRAWGFTLLGLAAFQVTNPLNAYAKALQRHLADKLVEKLEQVETPGWTWFEESLAYDNARLPQALIETGASADNPKFTAAGIRTLRWLIARQTAPSGVFRPVGSEGFGNLRQISHAFDQQPLEAAATIDACLAAFKVSGDPAWGAKARVAFDWFLGANDLKVSLIDTKTGSCCDGLHPDRVNENRGAESVLSYLLGLAQIRHWSLK